jgi:hypothetical protein
MTICPNKPTFSHDYLIPGIPCPMCQEQLFEGDTQSSTTVPSTASPLITTLPAPTALQTETAPAPSTSAQVAPLASLFRRGLDAASLGRKKFIPTAKTTSTPLINYVFAIRVAYAKYKPSSPISRFTNF